MTRVDTVYRQIGRDIVAAIERRYGKGWRACFNREVAIALVDAECFSVVVGVIGVADTARDIIEHGRACRDAALQAAGLSGDED